MEIEPTDQAELVTIIRPNAGWSRLNIRELWSFRDLLMQMATRDFRARYKQSFLGKIWVILQPLVTMAVYYIVFGRILQLKTGQVPRSIFLLAGIMIWQLFASSSLLISNSLTSNAHLLSKIYFPRLLLPFACSLACFIDFFFAFLVLLVFMVVLGVYPGWLVLACPFFILMTMIAGLAFGLWLAPWNVTHRDVQQFAPIMLQIWLYLSPVFYAPENVPERWRMLYYLNPMAAITQGFRWTLLGDQAPDAAALISIPSCFLIFVGGIYFFRRHEADFADQL